MAWQHMNLVLADTEEFRRTRRRGKAAPGATQQVTETEERRAIGLTIIRGAHVISLSVDGPPPADPAARLGPTTGAATTSATLASGPGVARPAGRGLPVGLTGPAAGVGGPGPGFGAGFPGAPGGFGAPPGFPGRGGPPGGPRMIPTPLIERLLTFVQLASHRVALLDSAYLLLALAHRLASRVVEDLQGLEADKARKLETSRNRLANLP